MKNQSSSQVKIFIGVIAVLILGTVVTVVTNGGGGGPSAPGQYDAFAKCIADSGAKFYGAFWCPHCHDQKTEFGSSEQYLPYVECSTPNAQGQTQVCIDKKIKEYPTWEFPDGTMEVGVQTLEALSQKTSCPLPGSASTAAPVMNTGTSQAASPASGVTPAGQ